MALTKTGIEFHLADARPVKGIVDLGQIREILSSIVRDSDGVFIWEDRVFVAIVSDVSGTGLALRRLINQAREKGLEVRIRLILEPFPVDLATAASKVILGEVPIAPRIIKRED